MAFARNAGFTSAIATDPGDTAAGYLTPTRYNLPFVVSGAVSGGIPFFDSTTTENTSALLAANSIVIGGGAGLAPFTRANLTYSEASGPQLQVGSGGTTSTGWIIGYSGSSTFACLTNTALAQTINNAALFQSSSGWTVLQSAQGKVAGVRISGSDHLIIGGPTANGVSVAGVGIYITPGIASTDVAAFSLTRTNNDSSVGTTVPWVSWDFTDTLSNAGALAFRIRGGAAGTTELLRLHKSNGFTAGSLNVGFGANPVMAMGRYTGTDYATASGGQYGFTASASNAAAVADTAISRISAGLISVGTGVAGSFAGSLKLTTLTHVSAEVDLSYSYNTPLTGATITAAAGEQRTIINPAGTLATLTVATPASPVEGQIWGMSFSQIITTLTITGTGGATVVAPPASAAVDGNFRFLYRAAITSWLPSP